MPSQQIPYLVAVILGVSCLVSGNPTPPTPSTLLQVVSSKTILETTSEQSKNVTGSIPTINSKEALPTSSMKANLISKSGDQNVSQVYQYTQQTFETLEDRKVQEEWGGNCTLGFWDKCKVIKTWFATHIDMTDPKQTDSEVDCKLEPVLCMINGWTVNRCHILCMGECNKEMMYKFEKYVNHEGECKAHAHG